MTEEMQILLQQAKEGDDTATALLIESNNGLIWSIVRRYHNRDIEQDDLYQLGCIGFLKAVQGYDEAYGTEFSTYAVPKISGEIRRFLRDDGAIKVGRALKQQAYVVLKAKERLQNELGRDPALSELSKETGFSAEEIAAAEMAVAAPESLQQEMEEGLTLESMLGEDQEERILQKMELRQAMDALPEKEKMIIALRYFRTYTQQECANVIKISQVQVSRLEKRALEHLRKSLSV